MRPLQPSPSSLSRVQHQPRRLTPLSPRPVASGPAPPPFVPTNKPLDTRAIVTPLEPSLHRTLPPTPEKHTHPGLLMRGHPLGMNIYSAARLGLQSHSRSARTRAGRARSGGRCGVGWGGVWGGRTCTQRGRGGRKAPQHILVHSACPQQRRRSESAQQGWLARQGARAVSVYCRSGAGPRASRAAAGGAAASPLPLSPGGGARRPGERGERKMGAARLPRTRALSYPARVRRFRVCGACPLQLWGAGRGCVGTRGACVGRVCGGARVRLVFGSPHRKCI